jgi:hypothetical protein
MSESCVEWKDRVLAHARTYMDVLSDPPTEDFGEYRRRREAAHDAFLLAVLEGDDR